MLFILIIISSIAEMASIGAVLPFISVLTAPEQVFNHELSQPAIQLFNIGSSKEFLLYLTVGFSILIIISAVIRLVLLWVQTRLSYAIGADISLSIYRRTLYQPYDVHLARNSSEVIAVISSKSTSVINQGIVPFITILNSLFLVILVVGTLVAINPAVAIISFVGFGLIYFVVIWNTKRRVFQFSQSVSRESSNVIKVLQEGLGGIRDVLIDGTQQTFCDIYSNADQSLKRAQFKITFLSGSPRFSVEALGTVLIAVIAYMLTNRSEGLSNALPVLGVLIVGAQRLLPALQNMYSSWISIKGGQASLEDTLDLLDQEMPEYVNQADSQPIPFEKAITLQNLSFQYTKEGPWVLKSINLCIPKGAKVGLIGATGSGKSTILDILLGLLIPKEGHLLIDEEAVTPRNVRSWQEHIAHVPQAIFLADATISQNIAFGIKLENIDYERVRYAAEKAQIAETIETWDLKYQTIVGERGVRLSGGQRQRIGIARALYKKADVIVFDEATSALDGNTEQEVMQSIESLGDDLTLIIVAHRISTLKNCSHFIELTEGKIKQYNNYSEIEC